MFTGIAENNLFHTNISFYSILRHCPSVSGETIPLYVPTRNAWKTQSLDILTSIWYCNYFPLVFVVQSLNLWTHGLKHARLPCPSPSPRVCSNSCPLSWWCHSAISSSVNPSPPALNLFQHQGLFQWVGFSYQVAKLLELHVLHLKCSLLTLFPSTLPHRDLLSLIWCFASSIHVFSGFPGGSDSNVSACNAGDLGLTTGLGRSPGEGNCNPLQYSGLENSMDRGAC